MKKILTTVLSIILILSIFSGCSVQKAELALITDGGRVDDGSFNQGAWEGLVKYAEEKGKTSKYYQPAQSTQEAYLESIALAVKNGAKVIVTPGKNFETSVYQAQKTYPQVNFILIDGTPHDAQGNYETAPNTVGIVYAEEQAGFLAGYAAVKDGMTKLGFVGGTALPSVIKYGYGFVQGAEYAAQEQGMAEGSITLNYHYANGFAASPEVQQLAASWYQGGTQAIFAAGGEIGTSVIAAAEEAGAKVIGVDVDQSARSTTVITSAMKGLGASVYNMIEAYYDAKFPGGERLELGVKGSGVSLAVDTAKFERFLQADYDTLFAALVNDTNGITSAILKDVREDGSAVALTEIPTVAVVVTEVK